MMDNPGGEPQDVKFNAENLYREETFTDMRVGTIRRMTPVRADGSPDETRTPVFSGEATIMTHAGPIPLTFRIEANTLKEAMEVFPQAVNKAVEEVVEEAREMRRQEASRIVLPGQDVKSKLQLP